jgi:exopolysaccharide production protein ExoZ
VSSRRLRETIEVGAMADARPGKVELYGIQMLRAVAALAVVCHHTLEQSNGAIGRFSPDWLTTSGASGVDIFFVISGFIMFYVSFSGSQTVPKPTDFLFRRVTRIYPFYWVCCLAMLSISTMGFLASHRYGPSEIMASFALIPGPKLIGVSWTLVYEIYFYLLFAIALVFRSSRVAVYGTMAMIGAIYALSSLLPHGEAATFIGNPIPIEFCFGLLLAYAYRSQTNRGRSWPVPLAAAILGLGLLAAAPLFIGHADTTGLPQPQRVLVWGVPAALVVAGVLNIAAPQSPVMRSWVFLGDASYALYLTHVFVMIGYGRIIKIHSLSQVPQIVIAPMMISIAISIGIIAHVYLEKPMLVLIHRFTRRAPGHANPGSDTQPSSRPSVSAN